MQTFGPTFSGQTDYIERASDIAKAEIVALRKEAERKLTDPRYSGMQSALTTLPQVSPSHFDFASDCVTIGRSADLSEDQRTVLEAAIAAFVPWKKGPFDLFGTHIDAEWRSELKWNRVTPKVTSLAGEVVADIGCNNGYFMYRMLALGAKMVVGFEPECRHALNFTMLQHYARQESLYFEPLGVEHMHLYPQFFDTIFCMGILYHHTDPVGLLRKMHLALKKGGRIIVECQGIPGEEPIALMPESRYARARGFWWLPSLPCLKHWMQRSGFARIDVFEDIALTSEEQRRSSHAPIDSLAEFLDPIDSSKTVEGYPAPRRFYLQATKS